MTGMGGGRRKDLKGCLMFTFTAKRKIPTVEAGLFGWTASRLWPEDEPLLAGHLLRLGSEDRRIRFGHSVSDRFLENYANLALRPGSIVIGAFADGALRGIGEARPSFVDDDEMEAAFTVETGYKGRGMGAGLFDEMMQAISNSGRQRVVMACIRSNTRMIALASKHGASLLENSAYQTVDGGLTGTLGDEMVEDVLCLVLNLRNSPWHPGY